MHIGIDKKSLEIRAAEFPNSDVGDALMPPFFLSSPPEQQIASVTADAAFDTRNCHYGIATRDAAAILPPRETAKRLRPERPRAVAGNKILRISTHVGRTIWQGWGGYHRRIPAGTKRHCVHPVGKRLTARDVDWQVAEFRVRVALLNSFNARGTPITEVAGDVRPGQAEDPLSPDLRIKAETISGGLLNLASPALNVWTLCGFF